MPRLGQFTEVHPDINVTVDASQRLANFQDDGIDIAVRQGTPPFGPGLVADQLFAQEVYAVCHPNLLNGEHPLRAPEDLAHHVLLHDAHGLWPLFLEKIFTKQPRPVLRSMSFNQTALAVDAAMAGQGVALVSDPLVTDALADGRLCRPFEQSLSGGLGFYVVAPRKPRKPETVRQMRAWLRAQAQLGDDLVQGP